MLSNTAETKPRVSATAHEASGSASTGIRDAAVTSDNKNTEPLKASGNSSQSGLRKGTDASSATQTAAPMNGKCSAESRKCRLTATLVTMAATSIAPTIPTRGQSTRVCWWTCVI